MPFVAACSFCAHRVKVPDRALGACLCCPRCGNSFTVAPTSAVPVEPPVESPVPRNLAPAAAPAPPPSAPPAPPPAEELPWWVVPAPAAGGPAPPPSPAGPAPPAPAPLPQPAADAPVLQPPPREKPAAIRPSAPQIVFPELPPPSSSGPEWINPWGAAAFFLAALALVLGALSLPRSLSLGCAGVGLLVALAGVAARTERGRVRDTVWLSLGAGGCGLLLLLLLGRPGWLSDRWVMDFEVPEPDRNKQVLVSRDKESEIKELSGSERADAARQAVRQGDMLLRVESAVVVRPSEGEPPVLLVKLHVGNVGQLHLITYSGQAGGEHPATARDSRGGELSRRDLGSRAEKLGQLPTVTVLPMNAVEDAVAVEAPWPGTAHVELDLPAAAWGCEGVCRFTIPSDFIVGLNKGGKP